MSEPLTGIAIVGLAGRFPGAPDAAAFWRNLEAGVEAIARFAPEELEGATPLAALPGFVPARAVVADTGRFDAAFFGIGPREARVLDPQQRLFLECAWHALEDAGCAPERFRGTIGVFAGSAQSSYYLANLHGHPELAATIDPLELKVGNDKDFLATTASYRLDLHGPSVNVSTACSTSLVAVHLACQALLTLECDLALAGGVTLSFPQRAGYFAPPGGILSPLGHCRAYDAAADGSVPGEAVAVVALRRLEDALADGDRVLAVIRGSALNNDGARKIGFTAPSVEGQTAVIAEALAVANVPAGTIGLIEGHGSGTPLGDMVELEALGRVFAGHPGRCALGSVKTAIGHCDAAAGIAGLVKATLALAHGTLPPSLGCEVRNPRFDWSGAPFWVPATAAPWPRGEAPRRAGVSSFGIGGTNAHVVLEEAPARAASAPPARRWQLLVLSAATPTALSAQTTNVAAALAAGPAEAEPEAAFADVAAPSERGLADFAASLARGRRALRHRRFALCRDRAEAVAALAAGEALATAVAVAGRPVAFLCSGVGDHYAGMAAGLYRSEAAFRAAFDRAAELALPLLGCDLRELVLEARPAAGGALDLKRMLGRGGGGAESGLEETRLLHPAVFAVSVATAALWASWGVQPSALLGYSLGEYVAAHLAGVLPLADALRLVVRRAELIASTPAGGMFAVALPPAALTARLERLPALALVAESGPELCVVAGPRAALEDFAAALAAEGVSVRRLPTAHAVHTAEMASIAEPFTAELAGLAWALPRVPLVSNVTGDWLAPEAARDPAYWRRHLLSPVRFARGLATLTAAEPAPLLLEIGPGHGLATLANQNLQARGVAPTVALASLRPAYEGRDDQVYMLETLGRLWLAGVEIDWQRFHGPGRQKVELPLYPFERERYWIDPPRAAAAAPARLESAQAESAPVESGEPERAGEALGSRHRRPDLVRPYIAPTTPDEQALAAIWEEVLGVAPVGVEDSFFELGGQSLLAPRILHAVATRLGCEVPLARLLAAPTVAALARAVAEVRAAGAEAPSPDLEAPDLVAEAQRLAPAIRASAPPRPFGGDGEGSVLLTGATGFIGAFLLAELLASTRVRVRCQVRAANVEAARARLEGNLVALGLGAALAQTARLELLPGDLAAPRWGLNDARFAELAAETTAIVHAGAWVNFTYPYAWLAPTNVGGTDTALELAGRSGAALHFVSSLSALVADPNDPAWIAREDDPLARAEGHFGGYAETKWVAEHHLRLAQERGIRAAVYRPGLVAGATEGRLGNTRDLMWSLLKGCLESGLAPALELPFDPVPADYLARALVHLAQQPSSLGRAFHFAHPAPPSWRSLFELARSLGWKLEILPPAAWLRQMAPLVARSPEHALAPFWLLLSARFGAAEAGEGSGGELRAVRADDTHTRAGLAGSGLVCPPLDSALLTRWLEAFVEGGFLPAPSAEEVLR